MQHLALKDSNPNNQTVRSIVHFQRMYAILTANRKDRDMRHLLRDCVSEFGRACERRKLRVNVGKSKVMKCYRYGNWDQIHVILNGEPLEEVDCFKYLGSQVAAD